LDRDPSLIAELEHVESMSHYFVASQFMGCRYSNDVDRTLQRFFGDQAGDALSPEQ